MASLLRGHPTLFMNIITKLPEKCFSGEELNKAFEREIRLGMQMEKAGEKARVDQARKDAQKHKGKIHPVLGECIATIPHRDFFRLTAKYGHDEVHSEEFIKYYQKNFSDLAPNKI